MADDHEAECILTAILALRKPLVSRDGNGNEQGPIRRQTQFLPDAVIRYGILSYRPFRSFTVVLVRGADAATNTAAAAVAAAADRNHRHRHPPRHRLLEEEPPPPPPPPVATKQHHHYRKTYSLEFDSNRGPLRFRVVELPYLPPRRLVHARNPSSAGVVVNYDDDTTDDDCDDDNDYDDDDALYNNADGVIISCYISRFFEFCDRYGYNYASSSILEDVQARQGNNQQRLQPRQQLLLRRRRGTRKRKRNRGNHRPSTNTATNDRRQRRRLATATATPIESSSLRDETFDETEWGAEESPKSIVLCGNNVDVTRADARLSCIVYRFGDRDGVAPSPAEGSTPVGSPSLAGSPPTSYVEAPKHPFLSLARSLTSDDGLEFVADKSKGRPLDHKSSASSSTDKNNKSKETMVETGSLRVSVQPRVVSSTNHETHNTHTDTDGNSDSNSNSSDDEADSSRHWNWLRAQVSLSSSSSSLSSMS